jgi:hypothetical protein
MTLYREVLSFADRFTALHLQRYLNIQNNHYRSSKNPHLTHTVLPHPVKANVWCAVSARNVGLVFFNETINCKRYVKVILRQFFPELKEEENPTDVANKTQLLPTLHVCPCRLCPMSSGTEL